MWAALPSTIKALFSLCCWAMEEEEEKEEESAAAKAAGKCCWRCWAAEVPP
jgi:hypothetical protein